MVKQGYTVLFQGDSITDRFARAYRHLLDETKEVLPACRLVLCEPFVLPVGPLVERWEEWRDRMSGYRETVRALAE